MRNFFQPIRAYLIARKKPATDIEQWRDEVLSAILLVVLISGILTAIPSATLAFREQLWSVILTDVMAIVWVAILWRSRSMPFKMRAWNFLGLIYLLGVWFLLTVGSVSQIYLMAFPVMTALLLGLRPAVYALALNALTMLGLGYFSNGDMQLQRYAEQPFMRWFVITLNFTFISSLLTISCGVLLQRLEKSLSAQNAVANSLLLANEQLRLISAAVAQINDIVMIAEVSDAPEQDARLVFVNDAFERRSGYRRDEVIGKSLRAIRGRNTQASELERIRLAILAREPVRAELINYTKSGDEFWLEEDMQPLANSEGKCTHYVAVGRDITERKKAEADIHTLAYFDVLTGLPNRRLLLDRMGVLLATAQRTSLVSAVLFIDLDHFKYINDARGHATGDALLKHVAARLSHLLREVDTVARIGGDEFVVLISNIAKDLSSGASIALSIAEKIRQSIAQECDIEGQAYSSACSIGVTLLPKLAQNTDDLLRESDTAMYRAKAAGRNQIAFFEESMQAEVEQRLTMEHDLAEAIKEGQLQMFMQAQVDRHGMPIGAELLMRWTHPVRGAVSPAVFIPMAEESGIILQLGDWALQQGCMILLKLNAHGCRFPLSINVSPRQFRQADFVTKVRAMLAASGAPASSLIFEVTEGLLIDNLQDTIARMHELCALGIRFSIDDFGTGYSSLSYLKRLPLYELKIDKSFVQDTPGDPNDAAIVQSILAMAKHLGLRVVAEGVETQAQADLLIASDCDALQGYLYSRPLAVDAWLAQHAGARLT